MIVPHPKGGGWVLCTCVEDNVVGGKEEYNAFGLRGFYYKLFK